MNKILLTVVFCLAITASYSQEVVDTIRNDLVQLKWSNRVTPRYVNFDVVKVMLGHGRTTDNSFDHGTGLSLRLHLMWPTALFKKVFPLACGITGGYNKITAQNARFVFAENKLLSITEEKDIKSSVQKVGYAGIILMHVIRKRQYPGFSVLTGTSLEYNRYSRIKQKAETGNVDFSSTKYINRFSLPLHLQISYSQRQFLSGGIFGSYDTQPRFKGSNFKGTKQLTIGASLGVIL